MNQIKYTSATERQPRTASVVDVARNAAIWILPTLGRTAAITYCIERGVPLRLYWLARQLHATREV
jgi:hypothetical protein